MKAIWFDVETTGLSAYTHDIIQLAGFIEVDGQAVEKFDYKCAPTPGAEIDAKALEIHSISEQEILEFPPASLVYGKFVNMLEKHIDRYNKTDKLLVYGYNVRFDMDFLRQFFQKRGDKYFGSWFWFPPIDVMNTAMIALADQRLAMPDFKLGTVAKQLGVEMEEADLHDAQADIRITREIYKRSIQLIKEV